MIKKTQQKKMGKRVYKKRSKVAPGSKARTKKNKSDGILISRVRVKKKKKEVIFPLYFGWEIVLQKVQGWRENPPGWFKEYRQYITTVGLAIVAVVGGLLIYQSLTTLAATYTWTQSSWAGGADTVATASHSTDQTGWTKFYSKDSNVTAGTDLSLSETNSTTTETTDADFNAGTKSSTYGSGNSVYLLKPLGASCSATSECASGACSNGTCSIWISGSCSGIEVYYNDVSSTKSWEPSGTSCDTPQCGLDGAQDGDDLVADNSVDFSAYPARDACKDLGGRLPTRTELLCIYDYQGEYGTLQYGESYWSSAEYSSNMAYLLTIYSHNMTHTYKDSTHYVRCVR